MESSKEDSFVSSASIAEDKSGKSVQSEALNQVELKKKIEEEDRGLTDAFLADILSSDIQVCNANVDKEDNKTFETDPKTKKCSQSDELPERNCAGDKLKITNSFGFESSVDSASKFVNEISNTQEFETSCSLKVFDSQTNGYRCPEDEWSVDEDSSSSSSDSDTFFEAMREGPAPKKIMPIKTKGELDLDDLPLIEDLVISVSEQEMEEIGTVYAIVDKLVVVRAIKDLKPLDLDSVLFLSNEKPLGRIFDVFGPVVEPFYSIRFNSCEHILKKEIQVDAKVYFAPKKNEITSYVFVDDLQNQKGSDASWKDNNEPPDEYLDYSDDEHERAARKKKMIQNRNRSINSCNGNESKRPLLEGDSPDSPIYIPPPRPAYRRTPTYARPNPFSSPRPLLSSPLTFNSSSPMPSPFIIPPRNHLQYAVQPCPQSPFQHSNLVPARPTLMFTPYQQPVFGQFPVLNPLSPALHAAPAFRSPVMSNVPTLIPASHPSPQNYFNQRFSPSPSPGALTPDPWLPNRAPYQQQSSLPPNAPLTVQIPPNLSSPTLPLCSLPQVNGSGQPFMGTNYPQPFLSQQRGTLQNGINHPSYY